MNRYSPSKSLYRRCLGRHWYELDLDSNRYQRKAASPEDVQPAPSAADVKRDLQAHVYHAQPSLALLGPFLGACRKARKLAAHPMRFIFDAVSAHIERATFYHDEISRDEVFYRCAAYRRLTAMRLRQPLCLEASLGALYFLPRPHPDLTLCIGVRPEPFLAHAWLELDGVVLNDSLRRVEDYKEICVIK